MANLTTQQLRRIARVLTTRKIGCTDAEAEVLAAAKAELKRRNIR